ncbi:protein FAR1-RELATED SEQUENCE 5-like [Nicotiana sylvestris]|uniref:protein FAR1-RELATED SEQUENCE 5-like n=1 Tax=Nicotiana sylvestris TaxID=4096 RepID=UPI00388CE7FA
MGQGEAGVLLEYFEKKRVEDPSFFFAVQLDVNDMITNIFWADSKLITDYEIFGDWLFETFLRAMSGKTPKTLFTDQHAAMSKAISFAMPVVHHRKCIYEYKDEGEFINAWTAMLDEYNLHENEWLQGIYALREKLFATYRKQTFSGGMSSTQLNESLNSELKNYLQSDYNLVQFFKHYNRAIEDKRYNELQDTCDASQRLPVLKAKVPILFHAREVYTPNIFSKFQDEYMKSLIIKENGCEENNFPIMYKVSKYGHTREHIVMVTEADHISCTCMKFESMGKICCHTIKILDVIRGVNKIPDEYILKRWTKTAKTVNIKEIDGQDIQIKDSRCESL